MRHRRVYADDGNAYFNRAGPRIIDSLEILAHLLQSERYGTKSAAYEHAWRRL